MLALSRALPTAHGSWQTVTLGSQLFATIYDADDNKVGSVSHVHGSGAGSQVVIDVGGFLGIGAKAVAVPASQLDFMRDEDGDVHAVTNWTKDQLKKMPEHHDA